MYETHGTACNFVHKRILGAAIGFVTGGPGGAVAGALGGGGTVAQPLSVAPVRFGRFATGPLADPCFRNPGGSKCKAQRGGLPATPGITTPAERSIGITGEAVMGRFGAAMAPHVEHTAMLLCLPGMVLGKDDLCYNKGKNGISNSQRKWPKGTKPLGTPGEMAALAKAASFGRRMETTVKRMQKIGVLKKPASRKAAPRSRQIAAPGRNIEIVNVE